MYILGFGGVWAGFLADFSFVPLKLLIKAQELYEF